LTCAGAVPAASAQTDPENEWSNFVAARPGEARYDKEAQLAEMRTSLLKPVRRFGPLKRFNLLEAVRRGALTRAEAQAAHDIGDEEWFSWEANYRRFGGSGLHVSGVAGLKELDVCPRI
jgi:hypothetical protein